MDNYLYKRVMVIDDSNLDRYISKKVIEKNYFAEEIIIYNSVATALAYLNSITDFPDAFPEIIFLDINMPVMDGFDFVAHYMKLPDYLQKCCTIIMISSSNSAEDFERINNYPSVELFFNKPLSEKILNNIRLNIGSKVLSR